MLGCHGELWKRWENGQAYGLREITGRMVGVAGVEEIPEGYIKKGMK